MTPRERMLFKLRLRVLLAGARAHRLVVDVLARAAELHDAVAAGVASRWDGIVDALDEEQLQVLEELRQEHVARLRHRLVRALVRDVESDGSPAAQQRTN